MSLLELLGFVGGLLAMLFLAGRRAKEEKHRRRYPEQYATKDDAMTLQEWIGSFEASNDEGETHEVKRAQRVQAHKPVAPVSPSIRKKSPHAPATERHASPQKRGALQNNPPSDPFSAKNSMKDSYSEGMVSARFLHKEASAYDLDKLQSKPSRASVILRALPSPKNMVIIREILGPPKSYEDHSNSR